MLYSNTIGTTILRIGNGRHITLEDTLLVPKLGATLISVKKLARNGYYALFNQERIITVGVFTRCKHKGRWLISKIKR